MSWVHFTTRWKNQLTRKVGFEGTPKLDPCWKSQPVIWKVNINWICEQGQFSLVGQNFSWIEQVGHRFDRQRVRRQRAETSEAKTEAFALETDVFAFASRSKVKAKPTRPSITCSSTRTVPIRGRIWTDIEPGTQFDKAYPVAKRLNTLLSMDNYLKKRMRRSNSGDWKIIFGTILSTLNVGLMMYGRARWQEAEATRKDFNAVLIRQDNKFFTSELFKVIQDAILLLLHFRTTC